MDANRNPSKSGQNPPVFGHTCDTRPVPLTLKRYRDGRWRGWKKQPKRDPRLESCPHETPYMGTKSIVARSPDLSLAIFATFVPRWTIGNAEESAPELRARIPIRYLESWKIVWILEICGEREIWNGNGDRNSDQSERGFLDSKDISANISVRVIGLDVEPARFVPL